MAAIGQHPAVGSGGVEQSLETTSAKEKAGTQARSGGARRAREILWSLLGALVFLVVPLRTGWAQQTVAVISRDIRPYLLAVQGLEQALERSVERIYLDEGGPHLVGVLEERSASRPLFVAVGPEALEAVSHLASPPPTVAVMVWDVPASVAHRLPSLQVVTLRIPVSEQIRILSRLFPDLRTVIVPFSSESPGRTFHETLDQLFTRGSPVVRRVAVKDPPDWNALWQTPFSPPAAVLFQPDPALASPTVIRHVITQCLLRKILPIGYNRFFYEAGAGMSFIVDYEGVGRRAALLGPAAHRGPPSRHPPPYRVWIKERTLRFVGLELPARVPAIVERRP